MTALLAGKQWQVQILELLTRTIFSQSFAQALVEINRSTLPTFALLCAEYELFTHCACFIKLNRPLFAGG